MFEQRYFSVFHLSSIKLISSPTSTAHSDIYIWGLRLTLLSGGTYNDCGDTIRYNSFEPDEEKPGKEVEHDSCDRATTAENATATVSSRALRGECGP